jgi:signal transduction histidine kinase
LTAVRALRLALAPLGVAFGLAVEWAFYDASLGLALTIVDFVVGCVLIVAGTVAWDRRNESRVGPLMMLAGLTWFAGNLGGAAVFLHRGPLVHLVLSYPSGRLRGRLLRVVVAGAYLDALVAPLARNDRVTLVLAGAVALAACLRFVTSSGPARRAGTPALFSALALSAALALAAAGRIEGIGHRDAVLLAYDVAIAWITVVLLTDLLRGRWSERAVSGLVVDLGATSDTAGLRTKLARALGDPSLVLGFRLAEGDGFIDDAGRRVALPAPESGRTATRLEQHGEQIGVLVHDDAVLADPVLIDSVAAAARLALTNARLQAEARAQAAELESSRRRIVESTDKQRRRLRLDLLEGPERLLGSATASLAEASARASSDEAEAVSTLLGGLGEARQELDEFAQGLRPTALSEGGLAPALTLLASRSPVPTRVLGEVGRLPEPVEAALYFVCSEGLANAVKHAHASAIRIELRGAPGSAGVVVADDGAGGAALEGGTGLRGLADRVEALGGTLRIEGPPDGGTRLAATIAYDPVGLAPISGPGSTG